MNRRNHRHRNSSSARGLRRPRPDTPAEIQAAGLSGPFFREVWNSSSRITWQQFIDRWERRFDAPKGPRRTPSD